MGVHEDLCDDMLHYGLLLLACHDRTMGVVKWRSLVPLLLLAFSLLANRIDVLVGWPIAGWCASFHSHQYSMTCKLSYIGQQLRPRTLDTTITTSGSGVNDDRNDIGHYYYHHHEKL